MPHATCVPLSTRASTNDRHRSGAHGLGDPVDDRHRAVASLSDLLRSTRVSAGDDQPDTAGGHSDLLA